MLRSVSIALTAAALPFGLISTTVHAQGNKTAGASIGLRVLKATSSTSPASCYPHADAGLSCEAIAARAAASQAADADEAVHAGRLQTRIAIGTLVAAIVAAWFAGRAAHWTWKGAQAAVDTLRADRAWITLRGCGASSARKAGIDGVYVENGAGIWVEWENTGKSPAIDVRIALQHCITEDAKPPTFPASTYSTADVQPNLGPGKHWLSRTFLIDAEIMRRLQTEASFLWIYSSTEYFTTDDTVTRKYSEVMLRFVITALDIAPSGEVRAFMSTSGPHGLQNGGN